MCKASTFAGLQECTLPSLLLKIGLKYQLAFNYLGQIKRQNLYCSEFAVGNKFYVALGRFKVSLVKVKSGSDAFKLTPTLSNTEARSRLVSVLHANAVKLVININMQRQVQRPSK